MMQEFRRQFGPVQAQRERAMLQGYACIRSNQPVPPAVARWMDPHGATEYRYQRALQVGAAIAHLQELSREFDRARRDYWRAQ